MKRKKMGASNIHMVDLAAIGFEPLFLPLVRSCLKYFSYKILLCLYLRFCTMVQNRKKHSKNSYLIIHLPTSLRVSERTNEWVQRSGQEKRAVRTKKTSEQCKRTSEGTREWPSTYSGFLVILAHSALFPCRRHWQWALVCTTVIHH